MPNVLNNAKYDPPRMIPSLVEGFNTVASNVYLILFPILFDIFLWLGPRLRVKQFFLPLVMEASELSSSAYGVEAADFIESSRQIWTSLLDQLNLFYGLRTFPVGVPSLLVSYFVDKNPIGNPLSIEIVSGRLIMLWISALLLVGLMLGSLYYALVARAAIDQRTLDWSMLVNQSAQAMILSLILLVASALLMVPVSCLLSSLLVMIPSLGSLPFLILGFVLVWVLLPLVFSPHGIFAGELKATRSIVTSFRFVRSMMAGTGMFFIMLIMIGYGLDILWTTPQADSWLLLVGIFGHAFISSGLLAASFKYYDHGIKWQQEILQAHQNNQSTTA